MIRQRIERLEALSGGSDAAVVWLMEKGVDAASSFMRFQLSGLLPPLREHSVNVLSDLTISFADLANKASTAAGKMELVDYLGDEEAQRVLLFWSQEYLK
ncbi:hypothetical protein SLS53_003681 [Cytospora paraplurivora]|uniref:Uncharacterized protein n=1 Tax=Cytospora paraplurivora TaxID=2898453 RepID=A0AAN9UD54_9PEZI